MTSKLNKVTLKKLKELNTIWHEDSALVFKSSTERLVIGRYIDGKLVPLDNEAVALCEKWKFKYDTSIKIEGEEEDGEQEGDEEGEEEGEQEGEEEGEKDDDDEDGQGGEAEGDEDEEDEVDDEKKDKVDEKPIEKNTDVKSVFGEELSRIVPQLTESFSKKFINSFDLSTRDFFEKLIDNESNLLVKIKQLEDALSQKSTDFDNMKANFEDMKDKHGKLKTKFDGIKKLFS